MVRDPNPPEKQPESILPVEVEIYINPDGSVTFADLEQSTVSIASNLNPDHPFVCDAELPADNDDD